MCVMEVLCTLSTCCVSGEREFQSRLVAGRNDDAYCCVLTLSKGILSAFLGGYRSWDRFGIICAR